MNENLAKIILDRIDSLEMNVREGINELKAEQKVLEANQGVLQKNQETLQANQEELKAQQEELKANQTIMQYEISDLKAGQVKCKKKLEALKEDKL